MKMFPQKICATSMHVSTNSSEEEIEDKIRDMCCDIISGLTLEQIESVFKIRIRTPEASPRIEADYMLDNDVFRIDVSFYERNKDGTLKLYEK